MATGENNHYCRNINQLLISIPREPLFEHDFEDRPVRFDHPLAAERADVLR